MFVIENENQVMKIEQDSCYYPKAWLDLPDAPRAVYVRGDISLLQSETFTIVGSRRTPMGALKIGKQIAQELSEVFTLVTGTADGGDSAVIEGALLGSGKVICVLAGGFSAMPQTNLALLSKVAEKGLLLSPHPFDTPVREYSYEYRNKLLAKMGKGTLVLGAAKKSGALITAKYALKYGKKLFAIPYMPGSAAGEGCNALIKQGGILTECAKDITDAFGIEPQKKQAISLVGEEERVYLSLKDMAEGHVSELSAATGMPVFKLRAILSALEVKGVVVALGGNRYAAV